MLEVYTWEPNANSGKPLLCLKEKRVPFIYHYIDMGTREHFSPEFLKINPDGTIPAVVHDGFVMTESTPIMEYIDDVFDGPALRPADPYWRLRMRQVMRYMDNVVAPSLAMLASNRMAAPRFKDSAADDLRRELDKIPLPERREAWEKVMFDKTPTADLAESTLRIATGINDFEKQLSQTPFLAGEDYSLADINVMATFYALPVSYPDQVNAQLTPHLWDWLRRCHARPGIQEAFALSKGYIGQRAAEARDVLEVVREGAAS